MKHRLLWFLLGAACFMIAQPLLRMPLLQAIQKTTDFQLVATTHPMLIGILIAFSAGVFEESFRFLIKQLILKPPASRIAQPILFGLGHGLAEAVIVLAPAWQLVAVSQLSIGILERFLAVILHVSLTVIIWNGFQNGRRFMHLLIAIAIHGAVNALIPIFASHQHGLIIIEGALAVIDLILIGVVVYSRRYYLKQEDRL